VQLIHVCYVHCQLQCADEIGVTCNVRLLYTIFQVWVILEVTMLRHPWSPQCVSIASTLRTSPE